LNICSTDVNFSFYLQEVSSQVKAQEQRVTAIEKVQERKLQTVLSFSITIWSYIYDNVDDMLNRQFQIIEFSILIKN
jgi:hypothetical protein